MNGFYTKKGGQRVPLADLSEGELGVVRNNLFDQILVLERKIKAVREEHDMVHMEKMRRVNARIEEQSLARQAQRLAAKVQTPTSGRKFKDA